MPKLKFTLKAWPVIAAATIGLCCLTQLVAGWCGIELPEQRNVDIVRAMFAHGFDCWRNFGVMVLNLALIVAILPALEECIFRLPTRWLKSYGWWALFAVLFSAAHYLTQPFPDNAFLALAFFALAQSWLYRRTGYLWCAMVNHALFNVTNLVLMFFIPAA